MNANWYDVLDVEPTASSDDIRTAWRRAVADLDLTDRRFRVFNQAAEVLLDPDRRAAYDAQLAADLAETTPAAEQAAAEPTNAAAADRAKEDAPATVQTREERRLPVVPGWGLVVAAALVAASLVVAGVLVSKPSDASVANDTQAAQAAAERAIVPLLS